MNNVRAYPPPPGLSRWPKMSAWTDETWAHWMRIGGYTDAQIAQYLVDRDVYGVKTMDGEGRITWLYRPTPIQVRAHQCTAPNMLFGGAAGVSKSHWLRWDFYLRCMTTPGYQALLLRRTKPELKRHHWRKAIREAPLIGAHVVGFEIHFPKTGALIELGHCKDEEATAKYLSTEYDAIGADEGATYDKDLLIELFSRARTTSEDVQAIVRIPTNPGGLKTQWMVDRFIDRTVTADEDPYYVADEHAFIPGRLYDNPYLMDRDGSFRTYEKRLGPLGPARRQQLLDGNWDVHPGQFFPEFQRALHVQHLQMAA